MSRKNLVSYHRTRKQINNGLYGQYFVSAAPIFSSVNDTHVRISSREGNSPRIDPKLLQAGQKVIVCAESASKSIFDKIEDTYCRNKTESNLMIGLAIGMVAIIILLGRIIGY